MTETKPYGTWPSKISAADLATASPRFEGARFVGDEVWWGEGIAAEQGRTAVFRQGQDEPILPAPWNARSRVHEYGGGSWTASTEGDLVFVEGSDQRVYALTPGGEPRPLTPVDDTARHGALVLTAGRVLAVRERHLGERVPKRDIVEIPLDGSGADDPAAIRSLAAGSDFLAQPVLNPSGTRLAWIAWDHPSMPWDAAELRVGDVGPDGVREWRTLSATDATQAAWVSDDELVFSDDPTGRWNLYRSTVGGEPLALAPADADTGGPLWGLGSRWFAALDDGRVVAVRTNGSDEVVVVATDGAVTPLAVPVTGDASIPDASGTRVLLFGTTSTRPGGLWVVDVDDPEHPELVRGGVAAWDEGWLPVARQITVPGKHGDVHAFDYPPTNPDVAGPADELPPYVTVIHGGPTGHVSGGLATWVAYFTSRGIGVLDVNYGGSSGYGRAYRERLQGQWGVVDVDDAASAAQGLADAGIADPERLAIRGGSAGGLTVLGSLVNGAPFSAGIDRYGVADMRLLAADTHDFESRYLDGLVGPYPEQESLYVERSPLTHADRITAPVLILQGEDDLVVPPSQSEAVRDALAANGVPHLYVLYPGEAHGFRQESTIVDAAEREVAFLGAAFGFSPDGIPPLELD